MSYAPVWKRENGDELLIAHTEFLCATEEQAWRTAMGASLVEGALLEIKYDRVIEVNDGDRLPHQRGALQGKGGVIASVIIIAGPTFDAAKKEHEEENGPLDREKSTGTPDQTTGGTERPDAG